MSHARRARVLLALLAPVSWACSSGGGSPPPPAVSGTIRAAAASEADGDTADPAAPQTQNDSPATAQLLPGAVTVGGWASEVADREDWYRATLAAGQVITLGIADWTNGGQNHLRLCIFTTATPPAVVDCSPARDAAESLTIAAAGEYFVRVDGLSGASSYVLVLAQSPLGATAADAPLPPSGAEFVPGEVIVRFRDGALAAGARGTLDARAASVGLRPLAGGPRREMLLGLGTGAERARAFRALGAAEPRRDLAMEAVDPAGAAKADTLAIVKALRRRPDVASADLNYIQHPIAVPNDTYYGLQWHYPLIKLPQAWDVSTGSASVIVAVVDTGVFLAHPDLAPNLVPGYDFILDPTRANDGNGVDPDPDDPGDSATRGKSSYHGTHVAGTVAAASNNGSGVAGTSWGTRILPVRVLGIRGGTSFDIIQGVKWAAGLLDAPAPPIRPERPADVVNLSLGCQNCFSSAEQAAYDEVRAAGVVVVAAAGNESSGIAGYPASYAGVISVSAVDMLQNGAPYSNFGPNVDVAAPGGDMSQDQDRDGRPDGVASTWKDDTEPGALQAVYRLMQGTSMASPHVAGVIALMKAVCPALTPVQVDGILTSGGMTVDIGTPGRDDLYGHGLLDAFEAIQSAQAQCALPPATALYVTPTRLDYGPSVAALPLTAEKNGAGTLPTVSAAADAAWLTVASPGGGGLGTWTATVDRTGLPEGSHSATITFTAGTSTIGVPVTMQVGGVGAGAGDVGRVYVVLADANLKAVAQAAADPIAGQYAFSFPDPPAGSYYLFAGTDHDGDGFICDAGEACGAYPAVGLPTTVDVSRARPGLDFTVGYDVALEAASSLLPAGGLALPHAAPGARP